MQLLMMTRVPAHRAPPLIIGLLLYCVRSVFIIFIAGDLKKIIVSKLYIGLYEYFCSKAKKKRNNGQKKILVGQQQFSLSITFSRSLF